MIVVEPVAGASIARVVGASVADFEREETVCFVG